MGGNPDYRLNVELTDTHLNIRISREYLVYAVLKSSYFDKIWLDRTEGKPLHEVVAYELKTTDTQEASKAIYEQLLIEDEQGNTLVFNMLDKAAENAYEQGEFSLISDE